MSPTSTLTPAKEYPSALKSVLERAHAGDPSALPELKRAFDENPELAALFGDLVRHARASLLALAAGNSLTAREAIARQVEGLRARLVATAGSELEWLLVDRVCISWLEVYHGDVSLAGHLLRGAEATPAAQAAQKRLDRAHARFLSSIKTLATLQKLLKPAASPLDLLSRPAVDTTPAGGNPCRARGGRVPAMG